MKKSLSWVLFFLILVLALPVSELLVEESGKWIGTWPTVILCIAFVYVLAWFSNKKRKSQKHDK